MNESQQASSSDASVFRKFKDKVKRAMRTARQSKRSRVEERRRTKGMKSIRAVQTNVTLEAPGPDSASALEARDDTAGPSLVSNVPMPFELSREVKSSVSSGSRATALPPPRKPAQRLEELMKTHQLHVKVIRGTRLIPTQLNGVSNPYCKITVGDNTHQSNTRMGTVDPEWSEAFTITGKAVSEASFVVLFEVWSFDNWLNPDDFCGQAELDLKVLPPNGLSGPLTCNLTLYVLKSNGKKESRDFGDLQVQVWATSTQVGQTVLTPCGGGNNAIPTKESLAKCLRTKTLPSTIHNALGTMYDEPCLVFIKVSINELVGLLGGFIPADAASIPEPGVVPNAPSPSKFAMMAEAVQKLVQYKKYMPEEKAAKEKRKQQGEDIFSEESGFLEEDASVSYDKEELSLDGDEDNLMSTLLGHRNRSGVFGSSRTKTGLEDMVDDTQPSPVQAPADSSTAKFVYVKVIYAKQRHMSKIRRFNPETGTAKIDQSFVFCDTRPLLSRLLEIKVYCTNNKTKAGECIARLTMDIIPMLCTHMDADKAAEDETTRGHFTTFTAAPTVNKKFSLPFLQWPLEGSVRVGGLQMHIGSADYDFRPGMYDVPLIHPSVDPTNSLPVLANTLDRGQSDMSLSRMDKTDVSGTSRLGKCLLGKSETRRMNNPRADNLSPDLVSRSMGSVDLNSLPPTHHKRSVSLMPATSSGQVVRGSMDLNSLPPPHHKRSVSASVMPQANSGQFASARSDEFDQASSAQYAPANSGQYAPANSGQFDQASSGQFVLANSAQFYPANSGQFASASSAQYAPANSAQFASAHSGQFAPASSAQYAPPNSAQFAPANSGQFASAHSDQFASASSAQFAQGSVDLQKVDAWLAHSHSDGVTPFLARNRVLSVIEDREDGGSAFSMLTTGSKQQEAASQTAKVAEELSEKVAASRGKDVAEGVAEDELSEQGAEGQREDVAEGVAEGGSSPLRRNPSSGLALRASSLLKHAASLPNRTASFLCGVLLTLASPFARSNAAARAADVSPIHEGARSPCISPHNSRSAVLDYLWTLLLHWLVQPAQRAVYALSIRVKGGAGGAAVPSSRNLAGPGKKTLARSHAMRFKGDLPERGSRLASTLTSMASSITSASSMLPSSSGVPSIKSSNQKGPASSGPVLPIGYINLKLDTMNLNIPNVYFFLVYRLGPQWVKTTERKSNDSTPLNWELRMAVYQPSETFTAFVFYHKNPKPKPGDIKQFCRAKFHSSSIPPNTTAHREMFVSEMQGSELEKDKYHMHMKLSMQVVYPSLADLALSYKRPRHPPMWYTLDMDEHEAVIQKLHRKAVGRWLEQCNPPFPHTIVKKLLQSPRDKFELAELKRNVKRIRNAIACLGRIAVGLQYIMSWHCSMRSVFAIAVFVAFCFYPSLVVSAGFVRMALVAYGERANIGREPAPCAPKDAADSDDDEAPTKGKVAALKRQYDSVISIALFVQNLMDDVATGIERIGALFSWQDPVATIIFISICIAISYLVYCLGLSLVLAAVGMYLLRPPQWRDPEPTPPEAFYAHLPARRNIAFSSTRAQNNHIQW